MKSAALLAVFALLLTSSLLTQAQEKKDMSMTHTMKGYLVDKMCATGMVKKAPEEAMAKAAKHTKNCALDESCVESGFGLVYDGKWIKFDEAGDKKAVAWLKKIDKKNDLMVEVTGTHDGDLFKVASIKEIKTEGTKKEMKNSEKKHDDMKMDDSNKN